MVYKRLINSYALSTIVQGDARRYRITPSHRGVTTLEDYLPNLRSLERRGGWVYYVRNGPNNMRIFGIDGSSVLLGVPDRIYQEVKQEAPSVQYGRKIPVKIVMKKYRKIKRQR